MLPDIPEWWEIMLALMRINAIPIPATTLLTSKDIEYRLASADIKAIIAADEDAPKVETAVNNSSANPILILVGESSPSIPLLVKEGKGDYTEKDRDGITTSKKEIQQTPLKEKVLFIRAGINLFHIRHNRPAQDGAPYAGILPFCTPDNRKVLAGP